MEYIYIYIFFFEQTKISNTNTEILSELDFKQNLLTNLTNYLRESN
jgi:hypothetical protein